MADESLLTEEQKDLLLQLVNKDQKLRSLRKDRTIIAGRTLTGAFLLVGKEEIEVDYNDWVALCDNGLVTASGYSSGGELIGAISAKGIDHARYIQLGERGPDLGGVAMPRRPGSEMGRAFAERKLFWVQDETRKRYPDCVKLLADAASLFWGDNRDAELTTIGHKCREALEEFSTILHREVCPNEKPLPKNKTRNKLLAVIGTIKPKIGDANHDLADALIRLWEVVAVDKLTQKMVHGAEREGEKLEAADAERLLLYSHLVMAELDQLVHGESNL